MEAQHASRGRRTLEEIRQKRRAAEKMNRPSSGSDLDSSYHSYVGTSAEDSSALLYRIKELEKKHAEMEDENKGLFIQIEEKEIEKKSLLKQLNELVNLLLISTSKYDYTQICFFLFNYRYCFEMQEHVILPSLKKSLTDVSMEKDAAIVAREDLSVQLRTMKKRLKEAEDEQYRAEEDGAALRAEMNSLQQQVTSNKFTDIITERVPSDHIQDLERELLNLRSQLQEESTLRMHEQERLAAAQSQTSLLVAEKQELERRLTSLTKQSLESASEDAAHHAVFMREKERADKQLHDMALMVERLESSRQKLLMEIDSQSSEIERLFEENSNLSASYNDALGSAAEWEKQVKECLKKNQELRAHLDKLRYDVVTAPYTRDKDSSLVTENERDGHQVLVLPTSAAETPSFKDQLAKEQSKSEALSAEVMHLSAELKHTNQAYNNLTRMYKPVLRNIENNLMKMKQESFIR